MCRRALHLAPGQMLHHVTLRRLPRTCVHVGRRGGVGDSGGGSVCQLRAVGMLQGGSERSEQGLLVGCEEF